MKTDMTKVIVITGACGGMGRACVSHYAPHARIIAVDIDPRRVADLAAEFNASGHDVTGVAYDITDPEAAVALARQTVAAGTPRALIHTAGLSPTMAGPQRIMEVNFIASQFLADAFLDIIGPGFAGVFIASTAAHLLPPEGETATLFSKAPGKDFWTEAEPFCPVSEVSYSFSKWGVIKLCQREVTKWGHKGARINSISPGVIDTAMSKQEAASQESMAMMTTLCPAQRWGTPQEIVAAVDFLCSDEASFISGIDVLVDGGTVAAIRNMQAS